MPVSRHRRNRNPARRRSAAAMTAAVRPAKKKTNYLYVAVSALIAILVIGGFAVGGAGFGQSGQGRTGSESSYVPGVGEEQELMPTRNHVPEGDPVEYNTIPPTSGDHWAEWAACDFYEHSLPDERITHNLEHGNIVISYNLATPEEVAELRDAFESIGLARTWGMARAYDKLDVGQVAVAAWGVVDIMTGVDQDRLEKFFDAYAGNLGPEQIVCGGSGVMDPPPEDLQ